MCPGRSNLPIGFFQFLKKCHLIGICVGRDLRCSVDPIVPGGARAASFRWRGARTGWNRGHGVGVGEGALARLQRLVEREGRVIARRGQERVQWLTSVVISEEDGFLAIAAQWRSANETESNTNQTQNFL